MSTNYILRQRLGTPFGKDRRHEKMGTRYCDLYRTAFVLLNGL
jgi:hypothetical protein